MAKKNVTPKEELTNGLDTEPENSFLTASVTVNLVVPDVLGRTVETDEERELFLAIISSFFSSQIVYEQLKMFVQANMNPQVIQPDIIVPDKPRLILP